MILVEVANTFLVNMGKDFVILLKGHGDERSLPISIGQLEAQSIAIQLNQIPFPRPLTHDLFKNVLMELDCKLLRIEITELVDETFYAKLIIRKGNQELEIDSRPSDAIALALRFSAPIYVGEKVMDEAGVIISEESSIEEKPGVEEEIDEDQDLTPLEALQKQLKAAIEEERYEDAARLKDEIDKLAKSN
ncbi:MAG: bifunctional nuclease family protein [Fibrobacter sp.]|jgi:bifunctional DNase/RNase|nr:bifunctional nuclease family protein [Fibrobacter sp.]